MRDFAAELRTAIAAEEGAEIRALLVDIVESLDYCARFFQYDLHREAEFLTLKQRAEAEIAKIPELSAVGKLVVGFDMAAGQDYSAEIEITSEDDDADFEEWISRLPAYTREKLMKHGATIQVSEHHRPITVPPYVRSSDVACASLAKIRGDRG